METKLPVTEDKTLYKHALVCDIELTNGKQTKAIVIFNHDELNFENVNAGLNFTFSRCYNVCKNTNTFCRIKNGELKNLVLFDERKKE